MLTMAPNDPISKLKEHVLSAIQQFQESDPNFQSNEIEKIPKLTSTSEFELCKRVRAGRKFTGEHTTLGEEEVVKGAMLNWEPIIMRLKDGQGEDF